MGLFSKKRKKPVTKLQKRFKQFIANAWDGAGQGKRLRNWQASSDSINSLLLGSLDILRRRSRKIALNNPTAFSAIESIVSNCIGTGIKPQSKSPDSVFKEEVQELWLEWKDEADFYGVNDFYGLQALICTSILEGGECFVRFRITKSNEGLVVPLQLQALESEHLDSSKNETLSNGNVIRSGIEFNKQGKRVAYHLFPFHPGDSDITGNNDPIRIAASEILHIYKSLRIGQIRGVPWLSRVLLKLYELDQYDDAELVRKKTAALFAAFITRLDPEANLMGEDEPDADGLSLAELEPGTVQLLEPGEDIKFSSPSDVGGSYDNFMRQQLRFIAMGMGISYEQLTGDLTQVNFSSIRAGLIEFRRKCQMLQRHIMIFQLCRPVWNKWLQLAILSGAIDLPGDSRKHCRVKWIPQGFEWVDPLKDQKANELAVRSGFTSRSEIVSRMGGDVEEIDREIASDNERADALGLVHGTDPRLAKESILPADSNDDENQS